jgi:hypothetical protein
MRKTARPVVWEGGGAQSPSLDPIAHARLVNAQPHEYRDARVGKRYYRSTLLLGIEVLSVEESRRHQTDIARHLPLGPEVLADLDPAS